MVKTFTTFTFLHYVYAQLAEITLKTTKNQSLLTGYVWYLGKTNTTIAFRFAICGMTQKLIQFPAIVLQ